MSSRPSPLRELKHRYRTLRIVEVTVLSLGVGFLAFAIMASFAGSGPLTVLFAGILGLLLLLGRYRHLGLHQLTEQAIAGYLNLHFPGLQDSTDLLITKAEDLGPLQQLQRKRLLASFDQAAQNVRWPQQWRWSFVVLIAGIGALLMLDSGSWINGAQPILSVSSLGDSLPATQTRPEPAVLQQVSISVSPPGYTGLKTRSTKNFNLTIPEGSLITWQVSFSGAPTQVSLVFSDGDSTALILVKGAFSGQRSISQSGFYQLQWLDQGVMQSSQYFKLEVVDDQIPQVVITNQEQFVQLPWDQEISLSVKASLIDDYGLSEAYIIATVSKGNGESVKFREEKLPFVQPKTIAGKKVQATLELNTRKLGMEPGDELYYYVEAWDNKSPQRQANRTETYFIQLQDTTTQEISFEGGLGVDLMPEYFRSQRQIIIDSEKLLAEKTKIEKKEFNSKSNELGYDQKVLRLRYGQFLGEEFASGIAAESQPTEDQKAPENEADAIKQFGHTHDSENEHNLVPGPAQETAPGKKEESAIADFAHLHDNSEEATFFIQSTKAKLRAALTLMWDAELHLRLFDPAASLPYQYQILKLLKEISNDSRIYVHRTGFDPPPLKEEKRLSGALDEVKSSSAKYNSSKTEAFPGIRRALPIVERLLESEKNTLSETERPLLMEAGNELAAAAIEQPNVYLVRLSDLKSVLDGDLSKEKLLSVRQAFWQLLPDLPRAIAGDRHTGHSLQEAFIQQLKAQGYR